VEFREVVRKRRMVRNYDPDRPVPPEITQRILEHAIRAPSAGFSQGWGFLVLEDPADRERFWAAATPPTQVWQQWLENMRHAPLIIVPHSNKGVYLDRYAEDDKGWADRDENRWPVPYWDIDTGCASLLMLLTAVDEGLGACFFGIPPDRTDGLPGRVRGARRLHPDRGGRGRLPGARPPFRLAQARSAPGGRSGASRAVVRLDLRTLGVAR
jgi:nitroreductase